MVIKQTLTVVSHISVNSRRTTYGPRDVNATGIGADNNVLPRVNGNAVHTVPVQYAMSRLIGIEQQHALTTAVALHLIDALTVNTDEHRLVIVRTDTPNGVLLQGIARKTDKAIGLYMALLTKGYNVQALLIAAHPQFTRQFVVVATLRIVWK